MTIATENRRAGNFAKRKPYKRLWVIPVSDGNPGHYIDCVVQDAERDVRVQGHALHIVNGKPAVTFACGLANMSFDPVNAHCFPHSVVLPVFMKTIGFIVTGEKCFVEELDTELPVAVRYSHKYGKLTELNDEGKAQELARTNPLYFEREFLFQVPKKTPHWPGAHITVLPNGSTKRAYMPRGSLRRAYKAGLISLEEARARLKQPNIDSYEKTTTEAEIIYG
jgi:hypothetical protein